jgi:hypothetical protein
VVARAVTTKDTAFFIFIGVAFVIAWFGQTGYDISIAMLVLAGCSMIFNLIP